uniref:Uncharacterized protein n=1 Tax=Anguilla anguilla TaxID=7936 RepID=A0A0E9UAW6_ANGAN
MSNRRTCVCVCVREKRECPV